MTEGAKLQAAEVTSLASTLATLRTEVTDLESDNDALREKATRLHDASALREHARKDEIASLHQSLLSTQVSCRLHVWRIEY